MLMPSPDTIALTLPVPEAESFHLQHDERYIVILRTPIRPAIAGSDEVVDDLLRRASSRFDQRLLRSGIVEQLPILIETLRKTVAHQNHNVAPLNRVFLRAITIV